MVIAQKCLGATDRYIMTKPILPQCSLAGCAAGDPEHGRSNPLPGQPGIHGAGGPSAQRRVGLDAQRFPGSDILCALLKNGQGIVSHLRKKLILLPLIKNEVFL